MASMTFEKHLWVTRRGEYRVGGIITTGGRSLGSLGKIASRLRQFGSQYVWKQLPNLPLEIKDAILAVAAHQDTFLERQAAEPDEPLSDEEQARIDAIGRW